MSACLLNFFNSSISLLYLVMISLFFNLPKLIILYYFGSLILWFSCLMCVELVYDLCPILLDCRHIRLIPSPPVYLCKQYSFGFVCSYHFLFFHYSLSLLLFTDLFPSNLVYTISVARVFTFIIHPFIYCY